MTTKIENMGGMSEGAIHALVLANNENLNEKWDARTEKQSKELGARMDRHENKVDEKFEKLLESVAVLTKTVGDSSELQQGWHRDDLEHRAQVHARLSAQDTALDGVREAVGAMQGEVKTVISDVQDVRHRLRLISGLVMVGRVLKSAWVAGKSSKDSLIVVAAISSSLVAIRVAYNIFWPIIHRYWSH